MAIVLRFQPRVVIKSTGENNAKLDAPRSRRFNHTMSMLNEPYPMLMSEIRQIGLLGSVSAVLGWDERVLMPPAGAQLRADQSALLATMLHERFTSARVGNLLAAAEEQRSGSDRHGDRQVNLREIRRGFDRARKLPGSLVQELAQQSVLAQQAWVDARKRSDFAAFAPWLEKMLALKKAEAKCVGYREHPYDALLDDYEPGATTAQLQGVFDSLRAPLVDLVQRIGQSRRPAPVEILERKYPVAAQEKLARQVATAIGFKLDAGRLDVSVHPFCTGIGPGDVRLTTRYNERDFQNSFFGTLHEAGHGLYEQNLPAEHFGTPRGQSVSLGIHESQSRLWENFVGRSRPFWRFFLPQVREAFGESLDGVSEDEWYRAINDVRPSCIRTEADETTYNLHVLLRFELEQAMIGGDLSVADLPGAWNQKMRELLGITPPDAARGVLQDIHWSGGGIGYFPTYTLGNLYAAQFYERARADLGELDEMLGEGNFAPLLQWLSKHIHSQGKRYRAHELAEQVTGKPLSAEPLLRHLRSRAAEVYGV
jgi:carboxypeptidase Taq